MDSFASQAQLNLYYQETIARLYMIYLPLNAK